MTNKTTNLTALHLFYKTIYYHISNTIEELLKLKTWQVLPLCYATVPKDSPDSFTPVNELHIASLRKKKPLRNHILCLQLGADWDVCLETPMTNLHSLLEYYIRNYSVYCFTETRYNQGYIGLVFESKPQIKRRLIEACSPALFHRSPKLNRYTNLTFVLLS